MSMSVPFLLSDDKVSRTPASTLEALRPRLGDVIEALFDEGWAVTVPGHRRRSATA